MPTIDNLDIQISSSVNHANASLTTLIKRLDRVSASLSGVNSRGLATMGSGINKLSNAMANFSANTRTADFSRLARNLTALSTVDTSAFGKMASGIASISNSLSKIPNVSESASKFGELAKGISQLGYKSATQAITNIPKLAVAMKYLMKTLSGVPKVSQNLIDMTNALAKLARTGASSGRATNSLAQSLNVFSSSTVRARKSSFSLASAIGKLYATYFLLFRAFGKIGDSIDIASDLAEVQNVVDVTFGEYKGLLEDMASTSIQDFGMSELTTKQVASRFQAMGSAMGFAQGHMAEMSIELTKLTADMASFYNVEQKDVAEDLASIFTGQTRPLRTYGLDLTEATLKEWAMRQGMQANIDTMSQMEKTMLRYQYVLANTGASQGDFARTSEIWANQIRILRQQFEQLGIVIGKTFISALKPLVKALNNAMSSIIAFAQTVSNALGKIFGWKFEVGGGGIANDLESGADYADDIAGGLGTASDNAKKLKSYLLGIDELNVLDPASADSMSGGGGVGGAGANDGQWTQTETIFDTFESEIDSLYELGEYIRDTLIGMMESIDWDSVFEKARKFGKGLAEFLNGLLAFDGEGRTLFGTVAKTLANTLNAIVYSALEFAKEFDFEQLGVNIADSINQFFSTFDFGALAESINLWVQGIWTTITTAIGNIEWENVWDKAKEFLGNLDFETIAISLGLLSLKFIDLKGSISNFASLLNGSELKDGMTNTETALLGSVDATIKWKDELSSVLILLQDVGKATLAFGLVQEPLKDNFLDLLGITTNTTDVTDEMKESYNGLGGTIQGFKDVLSFFGNTLNSLPGVMSGAEYSGRAMAIAFDEIAKGTIYTDEQLAKMQERWGLTEDDIESLRQEMLDANPALRTLADSFGLFDESAETLADISSGMSLIADGTVSATEAFDEFSKPMWSMTEEAKNFFSEIQNGNVDLTDYQTELENTSLYLEDFSKDMKNAGKSISDGLTEGMLNVDSEQTAQGLFDAITLSISNVFGIHSPAENMKPLGKNILLGIVEGFVGYYSEFTNAITTWWDEYVAPWFTSEQWLTLFDTIKTSLNTKWTETATQWKTNITNWWNNNVKPWFTKEKWLGILNNIGTSFSEAFETAKTWVSEKMQAMYDTVSGWIDNIVSKISEIKNAFTGLGGLTVANAGINISLGTQGFATGGFPNSADIFYANENGVPELVGTIGNRTAVASGTEITGISDAIYGTGEVQSGLLQTAVGLLQIIADKDPSLNIDGRDLVDAYDSRKARNGYAF